MRVKGKYEYKYKALNLKESVVKRFRAFSKKMAGSQSEALNKMIDFFERHGFRPNDRFVDSILNEIRKNRKRTEANIAILRDIEINQTRPNNAMLLSLFGASLEEKKPARKEKRLLDQPEASAKEIEITVPKIRYDNLQGNMKKLSQDFDYVLKKVRVVKSSFGKPYLKLEISKGELERFKRKVNIQKSK